MKKKYSIVYASKLLDEKRKNVASSNCVRMNFSDMTALCSQYEYAQRSIDNLLKFVACVGLLILHNETNTDVMRPTNYIGSSTRARNVIKTPTIVPRGFSNRNRWEQSPNQRIILLLLYQLSSNNYYYRDHRYVAETYRSHVNASVAGAATVFGRRTRILGRRNFHKQT